MAPGRGHAPYPGAPPQSTGPDLLVVAEGREHRFRHPTTITVGRLPECDVVIDDPACSRQHARIHPAQGGWVFQNLSREGSYAEGRPIQNQPFDETLDLRLGHPVAGPALSLVPILSAEEEVRRFVRRRRRRRLTWIGVAAAILVLVVGSVVTTALLIRGGGEDELTRAEADTAKSATVWILRDAPRGVVMGSGSILTKDGKILTNAHVADPEKIPELAAEGDRTPPFVLVSLTKPADDYRVGDPEYRAKVIASDGDVDGAVVQIYARADGSAVDPSSLSLPTMAIADSDAVQQGDDVTVFGFPAVAEAEGHEHATELSQLFNQVTQTSGQIATIIETGGRRSVFDVTARISGGNSGGAAVDDGGRLIGVPTRVQLDQDAPVASGRVVPVKYMATILEEAHIPVP